MKQHKMIKKMYQANLERDYDTVNKLRKLELQMIIERRNQGKSFDPKWIVTDL